MPRARKSESAEVLVDLGKLNPKQVEFFNSETKFTCYGGAKGGGKSHAVDRLAAWLLIKYPGIIVLIVRAHYPELLANHIEPMLKLLPAELYSYNGSQHKLTIELDDENGNKVKSMLLFGHWGGVEAENEYQGWSYDVVIIDEATQFSERTFRFLAGGLRGNNDFPKRVYLTCNPGGIGHRWVKRLFIDRQYRTFKDDPEKTENPADYSFIFARAEDNTIMLERNPSYLSDIAQMSNSDAMRFGNWDILEGAYFSNFSNETNVCKSFRIPDYWHRYRSFDYGLDMFVCCWWAVDEDGRCWCYRTYDESDLNIPDAVEAVKAHTLPDDKIVVTYAPPDMWNRQRETGKTTADIFNANGVPIVKADNNRVQGHLIVRTMLDPIPLTDEYVIKMYGGPEKAPKTLPQLMFFDNTATVYEDIAEIQADEKNPDDCSKEPHEITHSVDAVRYFCINRTLKTTQPQPEEPKILDNWYDDDAETGMDYESYMTGGEVTPSYLGVGA